MNENKSKSLMEKAPSGLHDFCELLIDNNIPKDYKILDIAAGTGAMSRRLANKGYKDITANDLNGADYQASEIKFTSTDLNKQFSDIFGYKTFDAIIAIEIIEHLENPIAFLRECSKTLKDNGFLLVTTPNVLGSESLMQFIKNRELLYFSREHLKNLGHISILPNWLLDEHISKCGFRATYSGYTPRLLARSKSINPFNLIGYGILKTLDYLALALGRSKSETIGTNYIILAKNEEFI